MHKWLGFSLFHRNDFHTVRNDELKLLYAMIKRKKVSPIKFMMNHWTEIPSLKGDVGCTSLVTRIARNLGLLANTSITYIDSPRWIIDYGYFNHAHMLKKEGWENSHDVYGLHKCVSVTSPEPRSICGRFICL